LGYSRQGIYLITSKSKRSLFRPVLEVGALASATGNTGVKRKREEEDVGVNDSPSKRAKTIEGSAYPPPIPLSALTPEGFDAQARGLPIIIIFCCGIPMPLYPVYGTMIPEGIPTNYIALPVKIKTALMARI
jgi:hypothetical protein